MADGVLAELLVVAAGLLVLITAAGLAGMWLRGGGVGAAFGLQLLGSGAIGVLLLLAVAQQDGAVLDVALLLALLAAVAAMALRGLVVGGLVVGDKVAGGRAELPDRGHPPNGSGAP